MQVGGERWVEQASRGKSPASELSPLLWVWKDTGTSVIAGQFHTARASSTARDLHLPVGVGEPADRAYLLKKFAKN